LAGERAGRELPERAAWLNPKFTTWNDTWRADRVGTNFVGGTFACLRSVPGDLWCVGDNRFGQLGSARSPPHGADEAAFLHVWPAIFVGLGTWHGCALAARGHLSDGAFVACWGRGDFGQLGGAARDVCLVDGARVPCAKSPQAGPSVPGGMALLGAGDVFTCVSDSKGVQCWGANRDAVFGTPGSCPASLRDAWPTLHGPVPAPRAACSSTPVRIAGVREFSTHLHVVPRAICLSKSGRWQCLGGIPAPPDGSFDGVSLSAGSDASACAIRDGRLVCWGEAYSPPDALDTPVPVSFDPQAPERDMAVLDATETKPWADACRIRRGCSVVPEPLPTCAPRIKARDWPQLLATVPKALLGKVVRVRGRLGVGPVFRGPWWIPLADQVSPAPAPAPGANSCGDRAEAPVVLQGRKALVLEALSCSGDDSRLCCDAPAYGQSVVATGVLQLSPTQGADSAWTLAAVKLCADPLPRR
jgi:hypothetical protein